MGTYHYMLCGWHTHSEFPLTGVPTFTPDATDADVVIEIGHGASPLANSGEIFEYSRDCWLVNIQGIADFEISKGHQIRVWPSAGATQKDIEIFLFGQAWGVLCHQRGILPLHASAIASGGGITAFAGYSGVGKSTTAALMSSLGFEVIADDILPVSFNQGSLPGAWPYLRRFKLHTNSVARLGLTPTEQVSEALDNERYFVAPKFSAVDKWSRLDRIFLLEVDRTISRAMIDDVTGADAVRTLVDQTYNFGYVLESGRIGEHLASCARLASKVAIFRVRRSPSLAAVQELGSILRESLEPARDPSRSTRIIGF